MRPAESYPMVEARAIFLVRAGEDVRKSLVVVESSWKTGGGIGGARWLHG